MNFVYEFIDSFFVLLDAMSLYVMLGLLIAGILKQLIPDDFVSAHLGKNSTMSVIKATILGIPLPVCSCSVIPLAQGLKKEGASKGAIQSFLISAPITGADSILVTYSFFGPFFTAFRLISSVIIGIIVGLIQNFIEKKEEETTTNSFVVADDNDSEYVLTKATNCCSEDKSSKTKKKFSIKAALQYGYGTLFSDMAKALLIGLILGALFTTFIPEEYSKMLFENEILTYFVVLLFAIPLYTCATASLPIAAALMFQGMSAGAVFIFLTAGPATSAVTMSVVYKLLGKTSLIVYVGTIAILSLLFGFAFDLYFPDLSILNSMKMHEESSLIASISSMAILILLLYHLLKDKFKPKAKSSCCS